MQLRPSRCLRLSLRSFLLVVTAIACWLAIAAKRAHDPLAHFKFQGQIQNEGRGAAAFELKATEFKDGALYLNGKYEWDYNEDLKRTGYRAVCETPDFQYTAFTVATRFMAEDFTSDEFADFGKTNILVGGTSHRWFGMNRSESGNLTVTFNNQDYTQEITNTPLETGKWTVVACGVDLNAGKVIVYFNGKKTAEFGFPDDFKMSVIGSDQEHRDKTWSFTNYSNGDSFHGLVDELIVYNRLLTSDEFSTLLVKR